MNAKSIDSIYLQTKIEPLLQFLLTEIILEQPFDPAIFVIDKLLASQFRDAEVATVKKLIECVKGHLLLLENRLRHLDPCIDSPSMSRCQQQRGSPRSPTANPSVYGRPCSHSQVDMADGRENQEKCSSQCNCKSSVDALRCHGCNVEGGRRLGTSTALLDSTAHRFPRGFNSRHRRGVAAGTFGPENFGGVNVHELDRKEAKPWILDALRSSPLLSKYPSKTLHRLAKACEQQSYSSGTVLWAPGFSQSLESTLIIEKGEVEVLASRFSSSGQGVSYGTTNWTPTCTGSLISRCVSEDPHVGGGTQNQSSTCHAPVTSNMVSSNIHTKGVILEEVALYSTLILDQSYRTKSNVVAWGIHRDVFQCIVQATAMERRDVYRQIIEEYLKILSGPQQLCPRPGFVDDLASNIQETEFQNGEVILSEGDAIRSAFYIETGIVRRSQQTPVIIESIAEPIFYKAGDFFGALDSAIPRTADNGGGLTGKAIVTDATSKYSYMVSSPSEPANVLQVPLLVLRALMQQADLHTNSSTAVGSTA